MLYVQGATARDYNRRKKRCGTYWADRFHPTLVETGSRLSCCLFYIALNMVRAKVVSHPSEWESAGYRELAGIPASAEPMINLERLLWCLGMPGQEDWLRSWYARTLAEVSTGYLSREPWWSEAAAVGSRDWIENLAETIVVGKRDVVELPKSSVIRVSEGSGIYALHTGRRTSDALIANRP